MIKVIKKDGTEETWSDRKILAAVAKAEARANCVLNLPDTDYLLSLVRAKAQEISKDTITSKQLHEVVIDCLRKIDYAIPVAEAYRSFRNYKETYAKAFEHIKEEADRINYLGDRENANFDSSLVSTKKSLIGGYLTKELYKRFELSKRELELTKRGDIYIHDLRDMFLNSFNCCLFDMGNVLKGGFDMSNISYTEPTSVLSALQVIGDITLVASAQQFGGFTIPEIDDILVPYCRKTYDKAYNLAKDEFKASRRVAKKYAIRTVQRELEQGFQSLELKLNTVPSSRGDFAFTTLTFGAPSNSRDKLAPMFCSMVCHTILKVRENGHGGKPVVFPKLVYLYDDTFVKTSPYAGKVFEHCVRCSSTCMYPDYLSLSSNHGAVSKLYMDTGVITSPMGCRAFLTPWKDPRTGKYVTVGRANIGAVSLNLPLIYKLSEDYIDFLDNVRDRLEIIRWFFRKRFDRLCNVEAGTNPMAFCQGGIYRGNLKPTDKIGDVLDSFTCSIGITSLNELAILMTGHPITNPTAKQKVVEVVEFIQEVVDEFKEDDGIMYALYGTPAESLCATQAQQYHAYCEQNDLPDEFEGVKYFTNSFHAHVSEDLTPFEKQDQEFSLFHAIEGGHIQYVRLENPSNLQATRTIIERGMGLGYYQGVNFESVYCEDCGEHSTNTKAVCSKCGSTNVTTIDRVCGYLGYSNICGTSRMNDGKMAEIADRKSM